MTSKVVSVEDCGPEGFRWITLKRITVRLQPRWRPACPPARRAGSR